METKERTDTPTPAVELVAALRAIVDDLDAGRALAPSAVETIDAAAELIEVEL